MEVRTEKKYTISAVHTALASKLLSACCLPDPQFPEATVHSVYYDTLDMHYLREKLDSTYLKAKVRVRWYGDWDFATSTGPAFLEAKIKEGGRQQKIRLRLDESGLSLAGTHLSDPKFAALPTRLASQGIGLPSSLRPVCTIRYRRQRFIDPTTGTRLALDQCIHASAVNLACPGAAPPALPITVLETKGAMTTLPSYLAPLVPMGLQAETFSKYLYCFNMLMHQC